MYIAYGTFRAVSISFLVHFSCCRFLASSAFSHGVTAWIALDFALNEGRWVFHGGCMVLVLRAGI